MSFNQIILTGRLGGDPEYKTLPSGSEVANFSLATTRVVKNEKRTTWHRIVAFGKSAEIASKYLRKGDEAQVVGYLEKKEWTGSQDGIKREVYEVIVERLVLLNNGRKGAGNQTQQPTNQPAQQQSGGQNTPVDPNAGTGWGAALDEPGF